MWKREGGWEAGAGREARLRGRVVQSAPRCPIQGPIVAPGARVAGCGFAQPVGEGRGGELQFPAGNAEPRLGLLQF